MMKKNNYNSEMKPFEMKEDVHMKYEVVWQEKTTYYNKLTESSKTAIKSSFFLMALFNL